MKHPFKLGREHLPFPNGGGLKAMSATPKSQKLELDALRAKHEVELQKLKEKHQKVNTAPKTNFKSPRKSQGR
jgi:hypothetical protein